MRSARERLNKHINLDNLKLIDDLAKMATGALGSFSEVRHQVKTMVRQRVDQIIAEMDMVTREEFERVEALAARARDRQEELEQRIAELEAKLGTTAPKKTTKAKVAKTKKVASAVKTAKAKTKAPKATKRNKK
jgi:BMFP domain-containing protein YqiC